MSALGRYLRRVGKQEALIPQNPDPSTTMIVVIPAFAEERLCHTVSSLYGSLLPGNETAEALIVFNVPFHATKEQRILHEQGIRDFKAWLNEHTEESLPVYLIETTAVDSRRSGVGFSRKTGMDEAVQRFVRAGREEGIIVSLDADALPDPGYLEAIHSFFGERKDVDGASVYFEHPTEGDEFPEEVYRAVTRYELHLRYHIRALRYAGSPYSYHTIGSCFAVRSSAYAALGGMNIRQGGEDFYFLQKVMNPGRFSEILTTRVVPSPRPSDRVPFGTGPVIQEWLSASRTEFLSYSPEAYEWLRDLFRLSGSFYGAGFDDVRKLIYSLSPGMNSFLQKNGFQEAVSEINNNVASSDSFQKRFFRWFNGFRTVKYLNYLHEGYLQKVPVTEAAGCLLRKMHVKDIPADVKNMLEYYRKMEKAGLG